MKDLNAPGKIVYGEFKVADYLPDQGSPKANQKQNSGILRSVIREGVSIKDESEYPMQNAGFLGAERNLLEMIGWVLREYPLQIKVYRNMYSALFQYDGHPMLCGESPHRRSCQQTCKRLSGFAP